MTRLAIALAIALVAGGVAWWLSRRQREVVPLGRYPSSVDLAAVGLPRGGVVVFVDRGCRACASALEEVRRSGRPFTVVDSPDERARLGVVDVPTTLEVGPDGVVRRGWVGAIPSGALSR